MSLGVFLPLQFFGKNFRRIDDSSLNVCWNSPVKSCVPGLLFTVVVQSLSHVSLLVTPWTAACQAPLNFTISWNLLRFMFTELVMPSNHLILSSPSLLPSVITRINVFSNESALHIRWPKDWSFSISPSNKYSRLISFKIDWLVFLAAKGLSRVFSSTTIQRHQFISVQPSLWSDTHICT